ncbi:ABC transporter ATP-binding protein [Paenibacillus sp. B01]|uniref:ABC transporter ATP-binding protein n=1 Tax=Paenibacillus sp. B01 TaxID=2660554 RepID=UPI00129A8145|nr:ABC transporter ATP-binding protein [Paenibacillus sp. B01]QGG57770.1 ATP-binding cassette domain-containing protein [Paenibacillus sp. B01]
MWRRSDRDHRKKAALSAVAAPPAPEAAQARPERADSGGAPEPDLGRAAQAARPLGEVILEVDDLRVSFRTHGGQVQAVRGVSLSLRQGETLAIVGESGCGKSVTARSLMRLLPEHAAVLGAGSSIRWKGRELTKLKEKELRKLRGAEIAMIFQDAMTALNPTLTIGEQLIEGIALHRKVPRSEARRLAVDMLELVGIPSPEARLKQYLGEFSGGMRQRIMIAIAASCSPSLLIADEPTTALDVTIQAQILDLFRMLQERTGAAIVLITHDLGVVAETADRVCVMYAGEIVESGTVRELFRRPQHPYTQGLLAALPRLDRERGRSLVPIPGTPPDLFAPPPGCAFAARCPHAMEVCRLHRPQMAELDGTHAVACWLQDPRAARPPAAGAGAGSGMAGEPARTALG